MLNENEKSFVRNLVRNELRLDTRQIHVSRRVEKRGLNCLGYEYSLQFRKGNSIIEIFVIFLENDTFLSQLKEREIKSQPSLTINYEFPFDIQKYFNDFFSETKLSLKLEIKIIKNDGSILSLIINSIKEILSDIKVPFFVPNYFESVKKYDFPFAYEIGIIDGIFLNDPNLKEEESSDGCYFFLVKDNEVKEFIFKGKKGISLCEINKNLSHIKNELFKK
ncbi:hypothetical protein TUBRATIS_24670 [Tubulinosema ratisbonensis]|uniref:Uncharacterized protein n=1 Tax=Tubulinosema ratisbonensis TaxID=291195 RepID=A0A437AIT4_9MICR|nr:hypothetical protein TUBRATIS_24670 [Tubulinosema ratisbonensis]